MAIRICPECGGKASDTRSDCPHCGYVFPTTTKCLECGVDVPNGSKVCSVCGYIFEQGDEKTNVEQKPHSENNAATYQSTASKMIIEEKDTSHVFTPHDSARNLYSLVQDFSIEEFERELCISVAANQDTPIEALKAANQAEIRFLKTPFLIVDCNVLVNYSYSAGYNNISTYWETVNVNGGFVDVQKTSVAKDWVPFSSSHSAHYVYAVENGTEDCTVNNKSQAVIHAASVSSIALTEEDRRMFGGITQSSKTIAAVKKTAQVRCIDEANKPGDRIKDFSSNATVTFNSIRLVIFPHFEGTYSYGKKTYAVSGSASAKIFLSTGYPNDSKEQNKRVKNKTRLALLLIILISAMLIVGSVYCFIYGVKTDLYYIAILPIVVTLVIIVFAFTTYKGIKIALRKANVYIKQREKISVLNAMLERKGRATLADKEKERILPQSLRDVVEGKKKGWDRFIYGITLNLFVK